ncbi:hypothetical protein KHA94_13540 [Bacillus sp. FJAT-49705]|uniref:HNH nuclease domain-containing protein n=1 Tax=Cytobacillus citreus TaxID=2833586 RepID=A0ABS5NTP4_9BACI|nr:hypothetical protein [Cytobacillus citreus]MBS4191207.1 hypothetical protein [Cytobacillus citreus]
MGEEVILTPIPSNIGFSNYLADTINGRIWSKKSNRFLNLNPNSNGYIYCSLIDDKGHKRSFGVHRPIMASHSGIPLEMFKRGGIEVDHIKSHLKHVNGIHNLELCDRKGQYHESTRLKMGKGKRLTEAEVCEILEQLQKWKSDEDNKISEFIHMTAEAFGQGYRSIWNIVNRKSWKHLQVGEAK